MKLIALQKLEDTLERNVEDFEDRFFGVEKDKSDLGSTDETNVSAISRLTHHITEKEQSTATRQNTTTENSTGGTRQFTEQTSNVTCHQYNCMEGDYNLPDTLTTFSETCRIAGVSSGMEESPLDCTSDVNQPQEAKPEPLDYRMDTDTEARYKSYTIEKILHEDSEENAQQKQGSDPSSPRSVDISYFKDDAIGR